MTLTFQNINSNSLNFNSLIGEYICFLSKKSETLNTTVGTYVTNCNYIYKVLSLTNQYMIVESDFHGSINKTKLKKETFEKDFFNGWYVISDTKPDWDIEVGKYNVELPNYKFESNPDFNKEFTTTEINQLLTDEFLNKTKTYDEVKECIETLINIIMKKHFNYINVSRSYYQCSNYICVGLTIKTGYEFLDSFGSIDLKSYRNKITKIEFTPHDWLDRFPSLGTNYTWSSLEHLINTYLTNKKDYIENLTD